MTTFRKINNWLHLWLGLASGIIMFIVCLTACIWVFHEELRDLTEPHTRVARQDRPVLLPSQLKHIAEKRNPGKPVTSAYYRQGHAIEVSLGKGRRGNTTLHIHPYAGHVLDVKERKEGETDFFRWVLNGHRFLWLPWEIGRPIVNYGTLVFVVILITGLVWWYPKKWTGSTIDKSFKIKWNGGWKRINLDLHNVLGFYSLLVLLALTGMVYGIKWYSQGLYWITSGGNTLPEWPRLHSDSLKAGSGYLPEEALDRAWLYVAAKHPKAEGFYYNFPDTSDAGSVINITIYPSAGKFYDNQGYAFDRHTLQRLGRNEVYDTPFAEAGFATRLRRMNYDIHVGSILGLPGKVLAFFASLIGASLPVTGFIIWWNRIRKKKGSPRGQSRRHTAGAVSGQPAKFRPGRRIPEAQAPLTASVKKAAVAPKNVAPRPPLEPQ